MSFIYILFTVLMFLDCVLLVFLVLLQLPKKDAGAGMAFGGAATDALFGAGSGNVLTKITKWVAGIFFGLALIMAVMASHKPQSSASSLTQKLGEGSATSFTAPPASPTNPTAAPPASGLLDLTATNAPSTAPPASAPAVPASNAPAPAPASGTNK